MNHFAFTPNFIKTGILLTAWGTLTVGAFWQREGRYLLPVPRPAGAALLRPETKPPAPIALLKTEQGGISLQAGQPITLLNFWSPSCGCSRYMETHVRALRARYAPQGVRFVTIIESEDAPNEALTAYHLRGLALPVVVDNHGETARKFGVWAAPAAVILDSQGIVRYLGAYNIARYCDSDKTAFAQQALEALTQGKAPPQSRLPFFGCQVVAKFPSAN